jgi:hypothetical protein
MNDSRIWHIACRVIQDHGSDASFIAARRAGSSLADGDDVGCSMWMKLSRAIKELHLERRPRDSLM